LSDLPAVEGRTGSASWHFRLGRRTGGAIHR
jgi:hypothetical protein